MKKIIMTICGAALVFATACNDKKATNYSAEDTAFGDSLAVALGHFAGANNAEQYVQMMAQMSPEEQKNFSKKKFLKGLELVMNTDTADMAFLQGIYAGLNLYNPVTQTEKMAGVPLDAKKVLAAFKEVYMQDSVTDAILYRSEFQRLSMQIQDRIQKKHLDEINNSEESKKNIAEGQEYVAQKLAEGYEQSESGLVYKIENPGTGEKVKPTDKVKIHYVGKHLNGEVFDETKDADPAAMRVGNFVPGFQEGLELLAKGGSATIVIPADLAYGPEGAGGKIGPNETLVFEITIDEIVAE